jgi:excisionase family DNA binding protein
MRLQRDRREPRRERADVGARPGRVTFRRCDAHSQGMTTMSTTNARDEDGRARAEVAPLLLTIPDAARVLAIGRTTLYELIDTRALEVVRIGRAIRVPVSALESFVERARAAGDVPSSTTRGPDRVAARSGPEPTT